MLHQNQPELKSNIYFVTNYVGYSDAHSDRSFTMFCKIFWFALICFTSMQ